MQCFLSQSWLITCAIYTVTWWQPSIICGLSFNLNQERWGLSDWSLRKRRGRTSIYHKAWAPFFTHSEGQFGPVSLKFLTHFCSSALYCWCYIKYVLFFSDNITFTPTMKPCTVVFFFLIFCKQKKAIWFSLLLLSQNNYRNWMKNNRHVDSRNAVFSKKM